MLVQGSQRIEIIVRKDGGGGEKNNRETSTDSVGGKNETGTTPSGLMGKNPRRTMLVNATHLFAVSKQVGNSIINYWNGGLGYESGDEAYQDRVKRQIEIVQDYGNIATSTAMGAVYGAAGGPFGIIAGVTLGFVSSAVSNIFKYKSRQRDYDFKLFKENNAIEYQRARAKINLTTGRLR